MASRSAASALRDLMLGSVAGTINVLTTTPLWVVNTRIKMQGLPSVDNQHKMRYNGLIGKPNTYMCNANRKSDFFIMNCVF